MAGLQYGSGQRTGMEWCNILQCIDSFAAGTGRKLSILEVLYQARTPEIMAKSHPMRNSDYISDDADLPRD